MTYSIKVLSSGLVALLLAGCSAIELPGRSAQASDPPGPVRIAPPSDEPLLVVSWSGAESCIVDAVAIGAAHDKEAFGLGAALITAIAPKIINKGLDLAAARLRSAAEDQNHSLRGEYADYFFQIDVSDQKEGQTEKGKDKATSKLTRITVTDSLRCLHLFVFVDTESSGSSPGSISEGWKRLSSGIKGALKISLSDAEARVEGHQLSHENKGELVLFGEFYLQHSTQKEALRLTPSLLYYGRSLDPEADSDSARSLLATVNMKLLGEETFFSTTMDIGKWQPEVLVPPRVMAPRASSWLPVPAPPEPFVARAATVATMTPEQLADEQSKNGHLLAGGFFLTEVLLVETLEGKKWKAHAADILADSKTEVAAALSTALIPKNRQAAEQADALSTLGLDQTLKLAIIDEEIACSSWLVAKDAGADDEATKWRTVVERRYQANIAAVSAGQPATFENVDQRDCQQ